MSLHVSVIDPYEENTLNSPAESTESFTNVVEDENEQTEDGNFNHFIRFL